MPTDATPRAARIMESFIFFWCGETEEPWECAKFGASQQSKGRMSGLKSRFCVMAGVGRSAGVSGGLETGAFIYGEVNAREGF